MDAGTILVVDDDLESLQLLTNILRAVGYQVRPADTGELALRSVSEKLPDLILLDMRMPGIDGFEVCQRLKARPETRDIPLMFISASHEADERIDGLKLGAVDFVSKPFRREELLARVQTHLDLGRLRAQLEKRVAERTAELTIANRQLEVELTERRLAEQTLQEAEQRFRNMADTAPVMIWVSASDKLFTFFNKGWLDFTGRSMEQELGQGWTAGVHSDDLQRCYETYSSSFDARRRFQMEYRLRRADGEYRWVWGTGVPRFEPNGVFTGYIGSCIDLTDIKLAQEQMVAAHKLESLGVLAAGIAHDFNNMLSSIFAEADLAFGDLPFDSPVRGNLDRICAVSIRASEVLNLLMDYAGGKGDETAFETVDLSSLIQEMLELLKVSISKKATFEINFPKNCPPVRANPTQLRRVVMNLVTNASEALGEAEGTIRLGTTFVHVWPQSDVEGPTSVSPGDYVLLEVSDTGCGMSEDTLNKVFDPFYTTKSFGRGLGLSAVQGIIRSHGGSIDILSEPGQGSKFRVFIPCDRTLENSSSIPTAMDKDTSRSRTLLLVEDEETLRLAVSMSLKKNGFSVLEAEDGRVALELFREHAKDIDVTLLDLTLPGLSGAEVCQEIRRIRPDAKIILTSAYDRDRVSSHFTSLEQAFSNFIRKPYRIADLLNALNAIGVQTEASSSHL